LQYHPVTTQRQKEEFLVALILVDLNPAVEPCKAQMLVEEELPTLKNTFGCLNHLFLGQNFVVPSNDSSALVTSVGRHDSDRGGGRGDGVRGGRDGGRGDG